MQKVETIISNKEISMPVPDIGNGYNEEKVRDLCKLLVKAGTEISKACCVNWFPCGFANLEIGGNNPFVRWIKKHGSNGRDKEYFIDKLRISKLYHKPGYAIYFDYPAKGPLENQSLNFKAALYSLLQQALVIWGIDTVVTTVID